ncbi:MAG: hypothetical protein J7518_22530 [Nocardioidaceae bacterium]|nr:hypothetical protein [Nocardioidaceae bacterium]
MTETLDTWWRDLGGAALVGTARRTVPAVPEPLVARSDAPAETALLDGAALGHALRRAGAEPALDLPIPDAAPDDERPPAPSRARQLLDLLLTQTPVGPGLTGRAVTVWLEEAGAAGFRVPHESLVPLLTAATADRGLRTAARAVLDRRGHWLAGANPAWAWVAEQGTEAGTDLADPADWALLATDERARQIRLLRTTDPDAGRALVESAWSNDPAPARTALLAALGTGISPADEPLLERALDDRAGGVRETAQNLLDGLPTSARARRLGALLAPLVSTSGLLKKKVHVELPADPDAAAVRDGLGKALRGRSQRGLWLERLAAGAPLETWTTATGLDPAAVVAGLDDADALRGLVTAAVERADPVWAAALSDRFWDPQLLGCLPVDQRVARVRRRIEQAKSLAEITGAAAVVPGPWPEELSRAVLQRLGKVEWTAYQLADVTFVLATGLPPSAAPAIRKLAESAEAKPSDPLYRLAQYLTLVPTIRESFR